MSYRRMSARSSCDHERLGRMSILQNPSTYEAIGTVGAFAIALVVWTRELRDRRREQAVKVSAWLAPPSRDGGEAELHLHNGSSEPVTDLRVTALAHPRSETSQIVPILLPPGNQVLAADIGALGAVGYLQDLPAPVDLSFVDSAGRAWRRRGSRLMRDRASR